MKLDKKQIFTIPNLLSTFRIVLAFVFLACILSVRGIRQKQSAHSHHPAFRTHRFPGWQDCPEIQHGQRARQDPGSYCRQDHPRCSDLMPDERIFPFEMAIPSFRSERSLHGNRGSEGLKENPGKQRRHVVRQGLYRLLLPGHAVASFHPRHAHEHRQHFDPGLQLFHGPVI